MNRTLLCGALALFFASLCWGSGEAIPLWKIEHDQGEVYLLGSVHLLKEQMAPYRPAIETAFLDSHILVVEADIGSEKMLAGAAKMMKAGLFANDESLETFLSPEQYEKLSHQLKDLGFDIGAYRQYRPWMLAMTVSSLSMMKAGYNPAYGVDLHFINRAHDREMRVWELERIDFQIQLFLNMSPEEETAFLFSSIADQKKQHDIVDQLVGAWKEGNLDLMTALLEKQEQNSPELKGFYQNLLQKRNEKMAEKIMSYISAGEKCLVIMGAAHLLGKQGVVEILREKGIAVSRQ